MKALCLVLWLVLWLVLLGGALLWIGRSIHVLASMIPYSGICASIGGGC